MNTTKKNTILYIQAVASQEINTIPKWFERLKEKKSQHKKLKEGKRESITTHTHKPKRNYKRNAGE